MSTTLSLGTYSFKTSYNAIRHDYAASPTSYVEVLEITDRPKDKERFVVNFYSYNGYQFCETKKKALAQKAFSVVTNGTNNVIGGWESLGIEKIYRTASSQVMPWFYSPHKQLFGKDDEFTTDRRLRKSDQKFSEGAEYFFFPPKSSLSFQTVAGIYGKDTIVWESGDSSPGKILTMINAWHDGWKDKVAIRNWNKFLAGELKDDIKLDFPIYDLVFKLDHKFGTIFFDLYVEEEFKGIVRNHTYYKERHEIPQRLLNLGNTNFSDTFADILKFFMQ